MSKLCWFAVISAVLVLFGIGVVRWFNNINKWPKRDPSTPADPNEDIQ